MITVGRGDTVYELAQRYNVPMREVIELNRLSPPYALAVGQRLRLPTARFYTVQRGDTMYGISRMHQVGMSELARANGLQEPYAIRVGQQLQLPGGGAPAVQVAENSRAALPSSPAPTPAAPAGCRGGGVAGTAASRNPLPPAVSATARVWDGAIRVGPRTGACIPHRLRSRTQYQLRSKPRARQPCSRRIRHSPAHSHSLQLSRLSSHRRALR